MTADLLWSGAHRADGLGSADFARAMIAVEQAWLEVLVGSGVAPQQARGRLDATVLDEAALAALAAATETDGTPVPALVDRLRRKHPDAARWVHRGLTSQDVVDTALILLARDANSLLRQRLRASASALVISIEQHGQAPLLARTLTQAAAPTTWGVRASNWLDRILDAVDDLDRLTFPVQYGGAVGTRAAGVELGLPPGGPTPVFAETLGLQAGRPWHTDRAPMTRIADAVARAGDACASIAGEVLSLARNDAGQSEVSESQPGGSSTMPHKRNPVLATQVRRAGFVIPALLAALHAAAADQSDERPAGSWQAQWRPFVELLQIVLVAAGQLEDLLAGLQVHPDVMAANLQRAGQDVLAEQRSMAELAGHEPAPDYLGESEQLVAASLQRARRDLGKTR
ncbi:3-carboxy-cis,cis-muconate cycloisomerase [Calidifontibacter sp. DB0510]|uniref:3-carboxy-cis,cis-muconate cycloisomerase n=1 Tax=Metallococcus carri TaxID=1656884 RepID=A0A967E9D7_9MICO|nr:lyase family protein [Metallococcus carri]NHN56267.1 3-carboxy-cis,cis-muconate cycloisomerase [Metallococcus carri]NOP38681.1 3-carboxy-cis,cis-muconate cycloisomerase [Calidifontibacter sp. DB2511S]